MFLCNVIIEQIYVYKLMQSVKHRLLPDAACLLISEYQNQMLHCTVIIAGIFNMLERPVANTKCAPSIALIERLVLVLACSQVLANVRTNLKLFCFIDAKCLFCVSKFFGIKKKKL